MSDVLERGPAEGERDREPVLPDGGRVWPLPNRPPTRGAALAELARLESELAATHAELSRLKDEARSRALARDELLAVVGHELRTPVTLMAGFHRLLLGDESAPLSAAQRQMLDESHASCRRLDTLVENLLQHAEASLMARPGAGGRAVPLDLADADVAPVLAEAVAFLRPLIELHQIEVETDAGAEPQRARFDAARVGQVVSNLLVNALKYSKPGSRVTLSTASVRSGEKDLVEISVCDQGPGVPEEERERIFEAWVRDGSVCAAGGLGLGLAICRRIVESHGGRISVSDAPGGGSRFAFTLPAAAPPHRQAG